MSLDSAEWNLMMKHRYGQLTRELQFPYKNCVINKETSSSGVFLIALSLNVHPIT